MPVYLYLDYTTDQRSKVIQAQPRMVAAQILPAGWWSPENSQEVVDRPQQVAVVVVPAQHAYQLPTAVEYSPVIDYSSWATRLVSVTYTYATL